MKQWAYVQDGIICLWPELPRQITLPNGNRKTLDGLTDEQLREINIYSYQLAPPEYDSDVQRLVGPIISFDGADVVASYQVIDKTSGELMEELTAKKEEKAAELASARYEAETGGLVLQIGGDPVTIRTDRESQALVTGAALQAVTDSQYSCRWKTLEGFVELSAEQIIALATSIRAHVQAQFDKEALYLDSVGAAGTIQELRSIAWE